MSSATFGTASDFDLVELALGVIDEATADWKRARDPRHDDPAVAAAAPDIGSPP
jgi:hypothetical protein